MNRFLLFLICITSTSHAHTLREFIDAHPALNTPLKDAYRSELEQFEEDPVLCSQPNSAQGIRATGMKSACISAVDHEHQLLLDSTWGSDWKLESREAQSPYGKVIAFTKNKILTSKAPETCSATLSIPKNQRLHRHFSFDTYCDR